MIVIKIEWRRCMSRTKSGGHCQVTYDAGDRKVERRMWMDYRISMF